MKWVETSQQRAFYTQNGWLELEIPHQEILASLKTGRDLWRENNALQTFLLRKLGPVAIVLTGKKQLRLGCDHYFAKSDLPKKSGLIKELMSIQGFALGAAIAKEPKILARKQDLGIVPCPKKAGDILFFRPNLLLDWPHLSSDLYLVFYAFPDAVYVRNDNDPYTNELKSFGYNFGDKLRNEFHPAIHS